MQSVQPQSHLEKIPMKKRLEIHRDDHSSLLYWTNDCASSLSGTSRREANYRLVGPGPQSAVAPSNELEIIISKLIYHWEIY